MSTSRGDDAWRPICGACGSTSIRVVTGACDDCGLPWDGSEMAEPVRSEVALDVLGVLHELSLSGIAPAAVHEQAPGETDAEFSARVLAALEDPRKANQ